MCEDKKMTAMWAFIRHGQTDWNLQNRLQGQADIPLNATGRKELAQTADFLADHGPWDAVAASPLQRAVASAEIIAARLNLQPVSIEPGLLEKDYGAFEGQDLSGLDAAAKTQLIASVGEPNEQVATRAITAINALLIKNPGKKLLLVSHGSLIRITLSKLLNTAHPRVANGEVLFFDPTAVSAYLSQSNQR